MGSSICHFAFGESFAGSLKQALRRAGRDDGVFCLVDDFARGPIDPPDPAARIAWADAERIFDWDDPERQIRAVDEFWGAALAAIDRRVVWVSKRVARDCAGFRYWVWRLAEQPYEVVEFSEAVVTYRPPHRPPPRGQVNSLALLTPEHLENRHDWDFAQPLTSEARDSYRADWERLRRQNAPLRILDDGRLVCAPLSHFDELLLAAAEERWLKAARIIGAALTRIHEGPYVQTDYLLLHSRVIALAQAGRLEAHGDLSLPRFGEVRLPTREATRSDPP